MDNPFSITKRDGIIAWKKDSLAMDPSIIVGYPRAPGSYFFHVDDILQIRPGNLIMFSTMAEKDPDRIQAALRALHKGRRDLAKIDPLQSIYVQLKEDIERLEREVMAFYEGNRQIKSVRQVLSIDKARNLITVKDAFTDGFYPRIFGHCTRVTGFLEEQIDEPGTDRLHKLAKKVYGSYDWESEFNETGAFPALRK